VASASNQQLIMGGCVPVTLVDPRQDGGRSCCLCPHHLTHLFVQSGFHVVAQSAITGRPRLREWWTSLLSGGFVPKAVRVASSRSI
jgi:hypothetical protein